MILQDPAIGNRSEVSWVSPERGLWVATRRGEYAGMVERLDGVYHARNALGRELGLFEDLDSARHTIDGQSVEVRATSRDFITKLLWAINAVAVVMALGLAFALLR